MSTHARIRILNKDGAKLVDFFRHHDGYPGETGKHLYGLLRRIVTVEDLANLLIAATYATGAPCYVMTPDDGCFVAYQYDCRPAAECFWTIDLIEGGKTKTRYTLPEFADYLRALGRYVPADDRFTDRMELAR